MDIGRRLEINSPEAIEFFIGVYLIYPDIEFKEHQIEQIVSRVYICNKCIEQGECKNCGCDPHDTLPFPKSCNNGELFPDFMNEQEWQEYKLIQQIEIK